MQVGDLVRWENAAGEYELGIVTSFDTYDGFCDRDWETH